MSLVKVECPICEFVFEANLDVTAQARCTCCSNLFAPGKSTIQLKQNREPQSQEPQSQETQSRKRSPSPSRRWESNGPHGKHHPQKAVSRSDQIRSSILLERIRAQRRSNLILLLLFGGTLLAGALVAKRFRALKEQTTHQVADLAPAFSDVLATTQAPNFVVNKSPLAAPSPMPAAKRDTKASASAPPLDPPKFEYLSPSIANDQAAQLKPYIMLLEIESPAGTTYATGTIVDSRGYLLTSLPAVVGATEIHVSSARSRSQVKNQTTPMSDTVSNVVAVSDSQQWALLEINRRLVLNAADIGIPQTDRIVSRQPLFRVVAPQSSGDYAISEMRVDTRCRTSDLTTKQKELLNLSEAVEGTEDVNWIISPHSAYDRLGAALVSTNGELMAVLVAFDQQSSYYVNTSGIGQLLGESSFKKKPLSSLRQEDKLRP